MKTKTGTNRSFAKRAVMVLAVLFTALTASAANSDIVTIGTTAEWKSFAAQVNGGETFSGKLIRLTADISVTTMAGSDGHSFDGDFDGCGHTLVLNISGSGEGAALFWEINNARFYNLIVVGAVSTTGYRPSTIASFVSGTTTIINCWSEVAISSTVEDHWVDSGALVGRVNTGATLTVHTCAFSGSVTYTTTGHSGGSLVGWTQEGSKTIVMNCVYMPSVLTLTAQSQYDPHIFISGEGEKTVTNCYYNEVAATCAVLAKDGNDASGRSTVELAAVLGDRWKVYEGMVIPAMGEDMTITSADDWDAFAIKTNNGDGFNGRTVTLAADISVTLKAAYWGTFRGTFDGGGHTLTVNLIDSDTGIAPFGRIDGAKIRNLQLAGSITSSGIHAAGLVGVCGSGKQNTISGCTIATEVQGYGYAGGIVGHAGSGRLVIENCIFSGTVSGSLDYVGGLVGWCDNADLVLINCLVNGSFSENGYCHPVACKNKPMSPKATASKVYYLNTITPTAPAANLISGAEGTPVSTTFDSDKWPYSVTAVDGNTYYANDVEYIRRSYDAQKGLSSIVEAVSGFTSMSANTTTLGIKNTESWYIVNSDVTVSDRIKVNGTVNLILCDGKTLTAENGIDVWEGNTLNIFAQSEGDEAGALKANGYEMIVGDTGKFGAAIGGFTDIESNSPHKINQCGAVTIHGGNIGADSSGGAGIGGGHLGNGGTVTVYGGVVKAYGELSTGIGGGLSTNPLNPQQCSANWGNGGTVRIYGGIVDTGGSRGIGRGMSIDTENEPSDGTLEIGRGITVYIGVGKTPTAIIAQGPQDNVGIRPGYMIVSAYPKGDANCDKKVDAADIVFIEAKQKGEPLKGFCSWAADMDGDTAITQSDIDAVVKIILKK